MGGMARTKSLCHHTVLEKKISACASICKTKIAYIMEKSEGKTHTGEDLNMVYVSPRNADNTWPPLY